MKRNDNEINDDGKPKIGKNNESYNTKIFRDYNSNVSCLPGSMVKQPQINDIPISNKARKNQTSDIFNTNPAINSFKTANKRVTNRVFNESNEEKALIPFPKANRPHQIRNAFTSQITLY